MRTLRRNKNPSLYYANVIEIAEKTETDKHGNVFKTGEKALIYGAPVAFKANIAFSGGNSQSVEFGLDLTDYQAIIVEKKGVLPLTENSLIWDESEPVVDSEGHAVETSADYRVLKPRPSLNTDRFVLKRLV